MQYKTIWRSQKIGPLELQLLQLQSFEQTVDELVIELEKQGKKDITPEDAPYFGQVWAAALGLSEQLLTMDLHGKKILEVGCGLALPSIVAAKSGALCTAIDIHRDVGDFVAKNLAANQIDPTAVRYICADWQSWQSSEHFDLIIASDVLYENHHPPTLLQFLRSYLRASGEAIIVDPCRWHHQDFIAALRNNNFTVGIDYRWTTENGQPVKLAAISAKLK